MAAAEIFYLDKNSDLWLQSESFGTHVDGNVDLYAAFQALSSNQVFVCGSDGNLWLERGPWGQVPLPNSSYPPGPSSRSEIDGNVAAFYAIDPGTIFVLGSDGNLWMEWAFGTIPPGRTQVDGNVTEFQTISSSEVFVLGDNGNLWREFGPFGTVPPSPCSSPGQEGCRYQVASDVHDFMVADSTAIFVSDNSGDLWVLTYGDSSDLAPSQNPSATHVDGNVAAFWAIDSATVYVLGQDGSLWLEHAPFGQVPLPPCSRTSGFGQGSACRDPVASNVDAFGYFPNAGGVFVIDGNPELWQLGPPKTYLAYPVIDFQPLSPNQVELGEAEQGAKRFATRPIRAGSSRLPRRNQPRA